MTSLFLLVAAAFTGDAAAASPPQFRIVGYLPDYRAAEWDLAAIGRLTDLVLFSAEVAPTGELDLSRLQSAPWAKLRRAKTLHGVRLILCVGGWERSAGFAAAVASQEKRNALIESAVRTCLAERLDGLDLDWEHPRDEGEQQGYALLLAELRKAFEPHGLTLSVTMAAWQKLPEAAFDAVDTVQVMAYDHPGRHATFAGAQADVERLLAAGVPARKLVLGLPFYGRDPARPERTLTYREIFEKYAPQPALDEIDGLYFNGPATISRKTQYARSANLAGVMIWELGQDASGAQSLLNAIHGASEHPPPPK